jgi:hypothetical protein
VTLLATQPVAPDFQPTGRATRHDDEELLALALLSVGDLFEAESYWRRTAQPPKFKPLLSAQIDRGPVRFDPQTLQYTLGGVLLSDDDVRLAVLAVIAQAQTEAIAAAGGMSAGAIDLAAWQEQAFDFIKRLHVATAAAGVGGTAQLPVNYLARSQERIPQTPAQVITLGDGIAYHFGRLQRFAEQIERRAMNADTPEAIAQRIGLYAESAYPGFASARAIVAMAAGFVFEENVLSDSEHCKSEPGQPEDCPTQTEKGKVKIGKLVPIGRRTCVMMCKCSMLYSRD